MRKISTRIITLIGLLVLVICFGFGLVAYMTSYNSVIEVLEETMPKVAMEASITIEDGIQNELNKLNIIASLEQMNILNSPDGDSSIVQTIMSDEVRRSGHKFMILIDKNGKALHNNGTRVNVTDNPYFKKALSGQEIVSEPMLSSDSSGIIMIYAVPVKIDNKIAGVLMAVRDGLELSEFAGRIKFGDTGEAYIINNLGRTIAHADSNLLLQILETAQSTDTNSSDSDKNNSIDATSSATPSSQIVDAMTSATSVSQETDITSSATTKSTENNNKEEAALQPDTRGSVVQQLGFEGFDEIQKEMMEGNTGFGEYEYNGTAIVSGYAPVERYGWSIAVAVDKDEMLSGLSELKLTVLFITFIFLLAGIIVAYIIGKNVSTPITYLASEGNIISEGDFSGVIAEKYTKRQDEIGNLAKAFNNINVKVSQIIRNVIAEANSVNKAIENVDNNMSALASEVNLMSGIISKLSSKMENNSAAAEEMNATSSEIEGAIDSIANETQNSAETTSQVHKRAEELKVTAINSQEKAQEIRQDVAVKLKNAIEQSKAVERIQILSDAILEISAHTHLLALNAAIEASRAGSAGSGFAVVAEEIRTLAENSKQTVNEIQKVTKLVIESVQALSESAGHVLEFLENRVVKDYDTLVITGEQYNKDAQLLNDIVTNLSATTEQLSAAIQSMSEVINSVATASEEGASETSDLANEAAVVVNRTDEVLEKTNEVSESVDRLLELVSIFKV